MDTSLFGLAVAPGLAIAIFIYWRDKFDREPKRLMIWAFFLGIFSILPALGLEIWWGNRGHGVSDNLTGTFFYAFIVVGLSEEISKFMVLRYFLYRHKEFNEPYDGITYAVMVSMGFATLENIFYVMQGGLHTAVVRMIFAVPAHATFAIIMGYFVGLAKFSHKHPVRLMFYGVTGATLFHGSYDFALMQRAVPELQYIGASLSLVVAVLLSRSAIRIHQKNSPFKGA